MLPQAEVCDFLERECSKAVCVISAFALVTDDQGATSCPLIAYFTVIIAVASPEPEDRFKRLIAGVNQRKHVALYKRVNIPVEFVLHQKEP